jgi:D-alanine-D-alanine ligase
VRIAVVYNDVSPDSRLDERDVIVQLEAVSCALEALGHATMRVACGLDFARLKSQLEGCRPDAIFNLVESLDGFDSLAYLPPALFEAWGFPTTGSSATAIRASTNKLAAKRRLRRAGLPTPGWAAVCGPARCTPPRSLLAGLHILKTVCEHASFGIDEESIIEIGRDGKLPEQARVKVNRLGRPCFLERFVDGREFNLSLLAGSDELTVLPPAEIDFSLIPAGAPAIVGYRAKWEANSLEYQTTPRRFEFPESDGHLLANLKRLAQKSWELFGLAGYARVDFRVDAAGRPWIIDVNANPCLSPDAGFAAALERAGIAFERTVAQILGDALHRQRPAGRQRPAARVT